MAVITRDQTLIDECVGGRVEAFGELVRPYQDRLFNALVRFTGSRDDAAELLQDALVRAWRHLATFKAESSFFTWLYRIAMNTALSDRRKARPPAGSSVAAKGFDPPDRRADSPPAGRIEMEERCQAVQRALAQVPEAHRAILILKDIEGMKYEEIADILEVPVGTVRSRLHRARSELRARLLPMMEEGLL